MELRVLGTLEVVGENGPMHLPASKHRRLLAALALANGHSRSVDELIEAVWGEAPPASARKLLQVYVSQLRKVLPVEARLVTHPAGYALELPGGALDASRFEQLLGEASSSREAGNPALAGSLAGRALALWRGRAYAEVADDDFARGEAERFEELRLVAQELRLEARLELGDRDEVLGELLALAAAHPLRESVQGLSMLALYRAGRQPDALDRYAATREALDELGLEPGAELRELQRRILQHDPTLEVTREARPASALPLPPGPLVGRQRELEALGALLGRGDARLVVLTGAGGSGKTRLALEAARELADTYADGAVLVELGSLSDPDLVVPTIARELGVGEAGDESPLESLVAAVASRELLLVIDNAEHLRVAGPAYVQLLRGAPRLTLLITSRSVLHLTGEHVFPVAPLAGDDALELFVRRARAANPSFALTDATETDARAICDRVDGLPLALELAAARIAMLDPHSLLERLSSRLTTLTGGPRDLPARQQTLRETLDWSVNLLNDHERRCLARLSVFRGGCTLDAAESVCEADLDTLAALVDSNLVRRLDRSPESRYTMLETIREHALDLLGEERRATELALTRHLLALADEAYEMYTEDPGWLARCDAEHDNLRLALDVAAAGTDPELELRLASGLWRFWWTRGDLDEGLARLEAALSRASEISPAKVRALNGAAGLAWTRGDVALAERRATEARALAREIDSPWDELGAHNTLGILANQRKDFDTARHHYEQAVAITESIGLEPVVQKLNLGIVALDSGDPAAAVALFEEVLAIHRRNDNPSGIGFATLNLGLAHQRLGDATSANESFQDARAAFIEVGFRVLAARALQGLAASEASFDRHDEAARLLGQAAGELGDIVYAEEDFPLLAAEVEAQTRRILGDEAFDAAYVVGQTASRS